MQFDILEIIAALVIFRIILLSIAIKLFLTNTGIVLPHGR